MNISVCIPVYRNIRCLEASLRGLLKRSVVEELLIHVQDRNEEKEVINVLNLFTHDVKRIKIASYGGVPENMSEILNRLAAAATQEWVAFSEQDTFLHTDLDTLVSSLDSGGYTCAGPIDTFHYTHPNSRGRQLYAEYGRLSPQPGFLHSALIFARRDWLSTIPNPFTVPSGYLMPGTGVLGAESYYGLRVNIDGAKWPERNDARHKIAFFHQRHCAYGYAAEITWGETKLATHLFYSGTKHGYRDHGFITQDEHDWLTAEETRFLQDYERSILG